MRYGTGALYLYTGGDEKVLPVDWERLRRRMLTHHFPIYRLRGVPALYHTFTGIDGTAYLIGGVCITFLRGGPVLMAPIRTGLGLRLGANIG